MRLMVHVEDLSVRLEDPEDLTEFAVHAPVGTAEQQINRVLVDAGIGELIGEHAWIRRGELAALARKTGVDTAWEAGFTDMLTYARSRGWQREDGAVRAHLQFDDPS